MIAAFDFDGTLTRSDTVVPFLRLVAGRRRLLAGGLRRLPRFLAAGVRRDRDRLRALVTDMAFAGRQPADVEAIAQAYGVSIADARLRPDTTARLEWHRQQGHRVVIVSASYEQYVNVVAARLGVEAVIATRLEVGPDGRFTGGLLGANCRGSEKVRRLDEWRTANGVAGSDMTLWAYGDSEGDRQLLAIADYPVWVRETLDSVAGSP